MHDRKEAGRGPRIALSLIGAAMLAGLAACEPGTDRTPGQERDVPEPDVGAAPGGVDLGARSMETPRADQTRFAGQPARDRADPSQTGPSTGDEPERGDDEPSADPAGDSDRTAALQSSPVQAHAVIEPTEGNDARGEATFVETDEGLEIDVTMTGLAPGEHGIHVHENGDCSGPGAEAAGDHFNPDGTPHGAPSDAPSERHAGDLGNLSADSDGNADLMLTMPDLTIEGDRGVVGRAIVVHSDEDDFMTQPSGDSGDRVACGVIEARAAG